jgi:hypothetical protein
MEVARDHDERLSLLRELRCLLGRKPARIGQTLRYLDEPREVPEVVGGRDDRHDEGLAERRPPDIPQVDPGRCLGERLEVTANLGVVGELPIGADGEAEILGGRSEGVRRSSRARGRRCGGPHAGSEARDS